MKMKFHKGKFYLSIFPFKSEGRFQIDKIVFELVEGWVDETNTIGFHKTIKGKWVATDIPSGIRITTGKTRKECAEFIETNQDKLIGARNGDFVVNAVLENGDTVDFNYDEIVALKKQQLGGRE